MSDSIFLTDGNGTITGLVDSYYSGELVIPEYVAGERITSIGVSAFDEYFDLISVIIPNSVTSIGARAFAMCVSLKSIVIPDSVTSISSSAFNRSTNLTTVYVEDSNNLSDAVSSHVWPTGVTFVKYVEPTDMFIKNTTLISLADKIRVLSGSEDTMTPVVMASNVDEANTEVDTQADLIAQIFAVLEEKFTNKISFSIDGVVYQAKEGMTWGEWASSAYNTGNFVVSGDTLAGIFGNIFLGASKVSLSDVIISNYHYIETVGSNGKD